MIWDIIVPNYAMNPDITAKALRCLETIREHSHDYRMIWVDNGTPEVEFQRILPTLRTMPHMLIRNRVNQGFTKATNQGLAFSTAPFVVLMNNDCEAAPSWLDKLSVPFGDSMVGLAGPLTTAADSWQGRVTRTDGWAMLQPGRMLAFFCVMIRRELLNQFPMLSEDFDAFAGLGHDDYDCWRWERAGWRLALVRDLVIPHHHRTSMKAVYGDKVPYMQEQALSLFFEKRREGRV